MAHIKNCSLCGTAVAEGIVTCPHCQSNLQLASLVVSLNERVARLEQSIAPKPSPVQPQVTEPVTLVTESDQGDETAVPPSSPLAEPQPPKAPNPIWQSDFWLNKIGIGLLFLALAFLFNYAVEQGWLTPTVRVVIGLAVGTVLLGIGYRIYGRRRHFSQVLLGGGIAAYYLTGFAAFQLYELISSPIAFIFMIFVTLLAFFLSLQQEEAVLSLIGTAGGLATPFLLYTGDSNTPGLIAYTSLLIIVVSAIYLFRGWRMLLWTAVFGGWIILVVTQLDPAASDRWTVQIGVIVTLIAAWIVPVWREIAASSHPDRWRPARLGFADSLLPALLQNLLNTDLYFSAIISPFIAIFTTWIIWSLDDEEIGIVILIGALIFGVAAWALKATPVRPRLGWMHGWTSALFLMLALALLLEDDALFLAWAIEAAALQLAATRWAFPAVEKVGVHAFWFLIGGWLITRLEAGQQGTAVFNIPALIDLGVIGLVVILFRGKNERRFYWLAAHIALLIWLWRELGSVANGQGLVSIAWGIYALILLGIGLKFHSHRLRLAGIATLFLLAGKLILVDLAALRAVWRILLFAGVGGFFLLISYYYRSFLPAAEGID